MKRYVALAILLAITACTTATSPTAPPSPSASPRTYGQSLMYGYETIATVRTTATALLKAGVIAKSDAQFALSTTDTSTAALDAAVNTGCPAMKTTAPGTEPACLSDLPKGALERLRLGVRLADEANTFVNALRKKE